MTTNSVTFTHNELTDAEMLRYARQILLDGWDIEAQEKLKLANVLIIGAGGIGCTSAELLARAGVGKITIVDADTIEMLEDLIITAINDAQKKAEQLHLSAVAFETQEAILITDAKEKIVKVNEAFTRITGYSDHEIIGQTPRVLKSGYHDKAFYETMWKALHEKGFWQGELWNKRKNGEIYAEFITITTIRDAHNKTTHFIANFNDITTHKAAQQQIQELAYYDPPHASCKSKAL